jgi:hypothetical protein
MSSVAIAGRAQAYLLYPFPHTLSDEELADSPVSTDGSWRHWFARSTVSLDGINLLTDHSYSFLPHVRKLLFPELVGRTSVSSKQILQTLDTSDVRNVRQALNGDTSEQIHERYLHSGLRLTWLGRHVAPGSQMTLRIPRVTGGGTEEHICGLRWIDAFLFPQGVGALVIALDLPVNLDIAQTARLLRFAKKIEYRRRLSLEVAQLSLEADGFALTDSHGTTWLEILPMLLRDLAVGSSLYARFSLPEVTGTLGVNWRLAVVANADLAPDLEPCSPFTTLVEQYCFALATGRMPVENSDADAPSSSQWQTLRDFRCLSLWKDWLMLHHYDNLVQVVASTDPRYVASQFENFENEYLLIFVLAIAQRHAIDLMQSELAQVTGQLDVAAARLRDFDAAVIRFTTRLWHLEVSTTPVGIPLYSLLRSGLGLVESLDSIRADSSALQGHLQMREAHALARSSVRSQRFVEWLAVVGVPLGVAAAILQTRLSEWQTVKQLTAKQAWIVIITILVVMSIVYGILRRSAQRHDEF